MANGGSEAIAVVAADLGRGRVVSPEFSLYERYLRELAVDAPLFRSNPNNPTGALAGDGDVAEVWDEAFYQLATGRWTRGDAERGSIVVGSLTKLLSCPGLRAGYVICPDPEVAARLAARLPQWSLNGIAAAALPDLLATCDLAGWSAGIGRLRQRLASLLQSSGLSPQRSDANFVLAGLPAELAGAGNGGARLRAALALEGVVVRDCASFGLPDKVRLAVPGEEGLERLARALPRALQRAVGSAGGGLGSAGGAPTSTSTGSGPAVTAAHGPHGTGARSSSGGAIMICGTSSDAGKTVITAGLCRALVRRGLSVAPFKGQNMSLNSYVTEQGEEISRAQAFQAAAARTEPEAAMNPVLLKPSSSVESQVVVLGKAQVTMRARAYLDWRKELLPVVLRSLADLRSRFDVVVAEGAGSPAEINLGGSDLANLGLAASASVPAVLVGDIDRGGVFASLYGTLELLEEGRREMVGGFAINKLRGDASLLDPGIAELERLTGVPSLGVVPYLEGLYVDAEDSLSLGRWPRQRGPGVLDVAVIGLPRISNFTDVDALALEPSVSVRLVTSPEELGAPDLVVLPGTKATLSDLEWLKGSGLSKMIARAHTSRTTVIGICGGYQMLGVSVHDDVESPRRPVSAEGLGLLEVTTSFEVDKVTRRVRGRALGEEVDGYEVHHGRTTRLPGTAGWVELRAARPGAIDGAIDGAVAMDGLVLGTSMHGLFESDGFRWRFLEGVAARRNKRIPPANAREAGNGNGNGTAGAGRWSFAAAREAQIDLLADAVEQHLDMEAIMRLIELGAGR